MRGGGGGGGEEHAHPFPRTPDAVVDVDGTVILQFVNSTDSEHCVNFQMESLDDGLSWSAPVRVDLGEWEGTLMGPGKCVLSFVIDRYSTTRASVLDPISSLTRPMTFSPSSAGSFSVGTARLSLTVASSFAVLLDTSAG